MKHSVKLFVLYRFTVIIDFLTVFIGKSVEKDYKRRRIFADFVNLDKLFIRRGKHALKRTEAVYKTVSYFVGIFPRIRIKQQNFKYFMLSQQYLPDELKNVKYYTFGDNKNEQAAQEYWNKIKGTEKK